MPLYEYECDACSQRFELIRRFSDPAVEVCQSCGKGPVRRLLSSPAIQFKGSGWYITDYARKAKADTTAEKAGGAGDPAAKTDAAPGGKTGDGAGKSGGASKSTSAATETKS